MIVDEDHPHDVHRLSMNHADPAVLIQMHQDRHNKEWTGVRSEPPESIRRIIEGSARKHIETFSMIQPTSSMALPVTATTDRRRVGRPKQDPNCWYGGIVAIESRCQESAFDPGPHRVSDLHRPLPHPVDSELRRSAPDGHTGRHHSMRFGRPPMTIVVASDHRIFVRSLVTVLSRDALDVVGVGYSPIQAVDQVRAHRPDVCLLDRRFSTAETLGIVDAVLAASPSTRVVLLTEGDRRDTANAALHAGAAGCVHKTHGVTALLRAIHIVAGGGTATESADPWVRHESAEVEAARRLAAHLTVREWQCLELLVEGLDSKAMAARLTISVPTVRSHVQGLLTKLGVHSRLEATSFAIRYSLVNPTVSA
ncbi:LuxR C-terminal-related transcriptional regulator [Pseudonocardia hispaniensis]|uniref:LuxR C-terminal-related transcriptional regulator n=1 Tax=Pseudonocardia hispaniensis TaxID=904933 RepID=A0ABW1J2Y2_9PSEU